jgi:hypothetical protein
VTRAVGDELVLVPLRSDVSQMNELFTMNETGRFIWENLTDESTEEDLAAKMVEAFEVEPETAQRDLSAFLNQLIRMLA